MFEILDEIKAISDFCIEYQKTCDDIIIFVSIIFYAILSYSNDKHVNGSKLWMSLNAIPIRLKKAFRYFLLKFFLDA